VSCFANKDPRFKASVFYNGAKWKNDSATFYYGVYHDSNKDGIKELYNERNRLVPGQTMLQVGLGAGHNSATKTGFTNEKVFERVP
jgi:hypothetical protein